MKVRDVMTPEVAIANADTTLEEIATMMKIQDTGAIPVVEEDELLGIVTDRDIVIRCIAEGHDPAEVVAEDVLTGNLEVVDPDTDVEEALNLMGRHQIRRLPVVDRGELVGMVSIGDLAVKQNNEHDTGEALKDVSQGVKPTRRSAEPAPHTRHASELTGNLEEAESRRVVSIRPEANALPRGQKKPDKRQAS